MPFELAPLPYAYDALAPYIGERTMRLHHGAHHQGYVTKLNALITGTRYAQMDLDTIVKESAGAPADTAIFNNAAQCANHAFFWESLTPEFAPPSGEIARRIDERYGSLPKFADEFLKAATAHFASGWAWLVLENGHLEVVTTPNAARPTGSGRILILVCDLWEHAYYLEHANKRDDFVKSFLDKLANWGFANANLRATGGRAM
jgi:superoxide dismutase, Fe-Mn family